MIRRVGEVEARNQVREKTRGGKLWEEEETIETRERAAEEEEIQNHMYKEIFPHYDKS